MERRTSEEQFNQQAAHYNAQWNKWSEESLRWLLEHAHCTPEHRLLDVATGTGFTALAFAPLVADVIGADVSHGMLEQAREQARKSGIANVRFEQAEAESLPFPDATFDRVTSRVAPHHFLSIPKFVSEAHRVLRPNGLLLIADTTVPDAAPEVDEWQNRVELLRDPSHIRNYPPSEWRAFVESAGFVVDEIGLQTEPNPIALRAWLEKGGCTGTPADEATRRFAEAPAQAKRAFRIEPQPDGDVHFNWMRVVLAARRA